MTTKKKQAGKSTASGKKSGVKSQSSGSKSTPSKQQALKSSQKSGVTKQKKKGKGSGIKTKDLSVPPVLDVDVVVTKRAGDESKLDDYIVTQGDDGEIVDVAHVPEEFADLTGKQKAFVLAYCGAAQRNATKAAELAGYDGNKVTLAAVGGENLRKPLIAKDMDAFMRPKLAKVGITTERTLQHLADIAYSPWQSHIHIDGFGNVNMNLGMKLKALIALIDVDPNIKGAGHDETVQPHLHLHFDPNKTPDENRRMLLTLLRKRDG